jgi:hypothetical protein
MVAAAAAVVGDGFDEVSECAPADPQAAATIVRPARMSVIRRGNRWKLRFFVMSRSCGPAAFRTIRLGSVACSPRGKGQLAAAQG